MSITHIYSTHKVKARKNEDSIKVQLIKLMYAWCFLELNGMNVSEASHGTFLFLVPSQHLQSDQMVWVHFLWILRQHVHVLLSGSILWVWRGFGLCNSSGIF